MSKLLTIKELRKIFNVSEPTIRRWIRENNIKPKGTVYIYRAKDANTYDINDFNIEIEKEVKDRIIDSMTYSPYYISNKMTPFSVLLKTTYIKC